MKGVKVVRFEVFQRIEMILGPFPRITNGVKMARV